MSLVRSRPQERTPWRDLFLAMVVALVVPVILGLAALGVFRVFGPAMTPDKALVIWSGGTLLMVSPYLAGAGMILAVPISSFLLRLGWFGWLPAAATGLGIGNAIGGMIEFGIAAPFGMMTMLILRAALGRLRPLDALA